MKILAHMSFHGFLNLQITELEEPSYVAPGEGDKKVILSLLNLA